MMRQCGQGGHRAGSSLLALGRRWLASQRDPKFAQLEKADVDFFRSVLGDSSVVTGGDALEPFNT